MRALTKTYFVEGLNQKDLLQRLMSAGVDLLKVKKIDQKRMEITIDSKDGLIFFAICKKTWYNKMIKVGGILSPFYLMVKKPLKSLCLILSFVLILLFNNVYLKSEYQGDALLYRAKIESAFESVGIKRYAFFNERKLELAKKQLQKQNSFGYLTIQKSGNKAIINLQALKGAPQKLKVQSTDLIAPEDLKILNATVYMGTLLKGNGESVKRGEVIVGAYYYIGETRINCDLCAAITAECTFNYQYATSHGITNDAILNAICEARLMLGEYEVLSTDYKTKSNGVIEVTLKYEKIICGG